MLLYLDLRNKGSGKDSLEEIRRALILARRMFPLIRKNVL